MIEFSLLLVESAARLSEDSVREGFCEAKGKRRDEVDVGMDEKSTITQPDLCINAELYGTTPKRGMMPSIGPNRLAYIRDIR